MTNDETGHQFRRRKIFYARRLRARMTKEECILWEVLRNKRFAGLKFRRQAPVGAFIVDFVCPAKKFVLEVDGGIHNEQKEYDLRRDKELHEGGYIVLRCSNEDVRHSLPTLLKRIRSLISPSTTSSSELERGQG